MGWRQRVLTAAAAATSVLAQPTPVVLDGVFPLSNLNLGLRHCQYVCSACPMDDTDQDFSFTLITGLNNASGAFSFQSANYPTHFLAIVNATSGAAGIVETPDVNDASWSLVTGLAPAPKGANNSYSIVSQSKGAWGGAYLTATTTNNAPCAFTSPSGDVMLVKAPASAAAATWIVGAPPPPLPNNMTTITVDASTVTNPSVSRRIMGCHSDYGFAQTPRFFTSNMIYGSSFEAGTMGVPAWTTTQTPNVSAGFGGGSAFNTKTSVAVSLPSDAPADAEAGYVNRGIGGAGLVFQAGKDYTFEIYIWTGATTTAFVELRDFTSNTSLARQTFQANSTGPPWGSTWFHYTMSLTPSAATTCEGIAFGSDPSIDCGGDAGPAHVCVRCGGEIVIGVVGPGSLNFGFTSLSPGAWGLVAGPHGPLPVLKSAGDTLTQLGVTIMRSGGSVSQSMRWKDWRGPVWNRASQQQTWGDSLLSGWGPFEVIDMCMALGIEPVITLAYDLNDVEDWADLVEYAWGDNSTTWGKRRALDGHPDVYNVTVFELGNEQYNPYWVDQVAAMEARSALVNSPPLHYMFPDNGGLNAVDAQRAINMQLPLSRLMPDLHVGAAGAVEEAAGMFANPVVPGYNTSAINCETNAGTHDMKRALDEAADLIDWMTFDTAVTSRIYARTASFCSGTSAQFDSWDQGISFFLPNMTWLQPPGYVHVMITNTWAEEVLGASFTSSNSIPFAAQRTADGTQLVLRAVNYSPGVQPFTVTLTNAAVTGSTYTLWTLTSTKLGGDNTPSEPTAIAPVQSSQPLADGTHITGVLPGYTFAIIVAQLA